MLAKKSLLQWTRWFQWNSGPRPISALIHSPIVDCAQRRGSAGWLRASMLVAVGLLLPVGGGAFADEELRIRTTGKDTIKTGPTEFANGSLPTAVGAVKTFTANALTCANANGVFGANCGTEVKGNKLTYTSRGSVSLPGLPGPLPDGFFTPGSVTAADSAINPPTGSAASGTITISGKHTGPDENEATVSGDATVVTGTGKAFFFGRAMDPWAFQMQDLSPIPDGSFLNFSLVLPASGNDLPATTPGGSWSVIFSDWIADINTTDVDTFYAADPDLLYSLTLSSGPNGFAADFVPGSPDGFPVTFSQTESQIEAAMLAALVGGWTGDLNAVSGTIDVGGHTSATVGVQHEITAAVVPAPAPLALLFSGLLALLTIRRRDAA
jgi:hypothetical protein